MKIGSEFKKALNTRLSPIGGGGNPLVAWVLACFDVVYFCIDWFLGCFNNKLCIKMHTTNIVLNLPTYGVMWELIDLKKAITPHLILHKKQVLAKSSSPIRGEESNPNDNRRVAFTLAEVATHVGISHNIDVTLCRLVESSTHFWTCFVKFIRTQNLFQELVM